MGFLAKITNKDIKVRGIKDDVMYSDTLVEHNYTLLGITLFKRIIREDITKHSEWFEVDEPDSKLGFKRK